MHRHAVGVQHTAFAEATRSTCSIIGFDGYPYPSESRIDGGGSDQCGVVPGFRAVLPAAGGETNRSGIAAAAAGTTTRWEGV